MELVKDNIMSIKNCWSSLFDESHRKHALIMLTGIGAAIALNNYLRGRRNNRIFTRNNVAFITGCDSGLGFNMALQCHKLNMFVMATCINANSDGSIKLKQLCGQDGIKINELNLLNIDSINDVVHSLQTLLNSNKNLELTAVINNAGIMCFGEFEWQTNEMIDSQIGINMVGTMKLTKALLPTIRQYKSRIITITSHCALDSLPSLSTYGATKAGLRYWLDSLRVEQKQYDVDVVNFIPGSFIMASNLSGKQQMYRKQMETSFSPEQNQFYKDYFNRFNDALQIISHDKEATVMSDDTDIMNTFRKTVIHRSAYAMYKCEPWR